MVEPMKQRFKKKIYDVDYFKPKKHLSYIDSYWRFREGNKPHSNYWGRKPTWRMKRREQRRKKHEKLSTNWDIPTL
jgi:hypothetical protein